MASKSERQNRLVDDPRLAPPERLRSALTEAEGIARQGTRWNEHQTIELVLKVWARVIDDIGSYRSYGADDYMHDISFRIRLDRFIRVLDQLGYQEALRWLTEEVNRLDQVFVERSVEDVDKLMLRGDRSNPNNWYLRRLPNDQNVVDHLRMIQPKKTAIEDAQGSVTQPDTGDEPRSQ